MRRRISAGFEPPPARPAASKSAGGVARGRSRAPRAWMSLTRIGRPGAIGDQVRDAAAHDAGAEHRRPPAQRGRGRCPGRRPACRPRSGGRGDAGSWRPARSRARRSRAPRRRSRRRRRRSSPVRDHLDRAQRRRIVAPGLARASAGAPGRARSAGRAGCPRAALAQAAGAAARPRRRDRTATRAKSRTWSRKPASGRAASARPSASARDRAETVLPARMRSSAADRPIRRGRRTQPPQPGTIPSWISGSPMRSSGRSETAIQVEASASSVPPPRQVPRIAATVGKGSVLPGGEQPVPEARAGLGLDRVGDAGDLVDVRAGDEACPACAESSTSTSMSRRSASSPTQRLELGERLRG